MPQTPSATDSTLPAAPPVASEQYVPAADALRYRERAIAAEARRDRLQRVTQGLRTRLAEARDTITSLERRHQIDRELTRAGVRDRGSATLLTEIMIAGEPNPDITATVAALKRQNPFLFRARSPRHA